MARRSSNSLIFDSLLLEGGLFAPAILEKAARGEHSAQLVSDYHLPQGLSLSDEQGRAFRIASALWKNFEAARIRHDVPAAQATSGFTLELLRDALGFSDIKACSTPVELADRTFPITAFAIAGRVPVVVAPHNLDLDAPDERFVVLGSGARRRSAYQLAQQFLNASADCTWAILTNGRQLRLVRDADTLTRPAFLEADLELILRDQRYADFAAVWRLFHSSRAGDSKGSYIWDDWKKQGEEQGERVRDGLRNGVTDALLALGTGFLSHPANQALLERLQSGDLSVDGYFQQLLRLIYRCLFIFSAEERGLLHAEDNTPEGRRSRDAYDQGYAFRRLRERALRRSGFDRHVDLWAACRIVFHSLATGETRLALPALGGLFNSSQCADLDSAKLENHALLTAMRHLRWSGASGQLSAIDYRNMGSEELGSVYESLLELVPRVDLPTRTFGFVGITEAGSTSGNARKTSGSYYTPDFLVQELIKSALDPVIEQKLAAQSDRPIEALLSITVCDPSCGSGHFLLAAARRLAEKLAELRAPEGNVRPDDYRHALRHVASRCLYGVDINPMAVELCRVALWLETVDPGKPLGFLDHHIRTGNSLLGTTPDLIAKGLPDDTFAAIEGDDKDACAELKKRNKREREGFGPLFQQEEQAIRDRLRLAATAIEELDENDLSHRDKKEVEFNKAENASDYRHAKHLADLWSAAFVIKKQYLGGAVVAAPDLAIPDPSVAPLEGQLLHSQDELFGQLAPGVAETPKKRQPQSKNPKQGTAFGITTQHLREFVEGRPLSPDLEAEVDQLATQYRFFHWHLAFPQVFAHGGFDCILGNPPWERLKLQEQEWFASRHPDIAVAGNAAKRRALIAALKADGSPIYEEYLNDSRRAEGEASFLRNSGRYPLCGVGRDINTAAVFLELMYSALSKYGMLGCVAPASSLSGDTTRYFVQELVESGSLQTLHHFENEDLIFPGVHHAFRFCLVAIGGSARARNASQFVYYARSTEELKEPGRAFTLSAEEVRLLNPTTCTLPAFKYAKDAILGLTIYRRIPVLSENSSENDRPMWNLFTRPGHYHMSNDAELFLRKDSVPNSGDTLAPLYESKMITAFDHRFGTYDGQTEAQANQGKLPETSPAWHANPEHSVSPRYWVSQRDLDQKMNGIWGRRWSIGVRDIMSSSNERTAISTILPAVAVGGTLMLVASTNSAAEHLALVAVINSFIFDYTARQKVTGMHLNPSIFKQLPAPSLTVLRSNAIFDGNQTVSSWIAERALELTYTAWDLENFSTDVGWSGPPFRWDEQRRFLLRCELDAAFFHLYLGSDEHWQQQPEALTRAFPTPRHAVSYVMDTFPIVKRKDEAKYNGRYRTKEVILEIYDALQDSIHSRRPYRTRLDPAPADPRCCHPVRIVPGPTALAAPLSIPEPTWIDRPLVIPSASRGILTADRYRSLVVPHLLYQAGGRVSFERFRRAYWLLTEPATLQRYATNTLGATAKGWAKSFREKLEKDMFIPHLKAATNRDLHFIRVDGVRWLELRRSDHIADDEHAIFDARLALLVAELWPASEPLAPLSSQDEAVIRELELVP